MRGYQRSILSRFRFSLPHFLRDPSVGDRQTAVKRNRGLPAQYCPQQAVVAVPSANSLWFAGIVALEQLFAGDSANQIYQLVYADQPVGAQIQRLATARRHQSH